MASDGSTMPAELATLSDSRFETDNSVTSRKHPKQQLSKGMQHMRFAVTADPLPRSSIATTPPNQLSSSSMPPPKQESSQHPVTPPDADAYGVPSTILPLRSAPQRSHSPSNNQKRTDPFAFGSRLLEEGDDIFEFNAWDHVAVDPSYLAFSEDQYARQRSDPVSDFDRARFNSNPEKWWNLFYKNNKTNFFKNRKWLAQEFPVLEDVCREDAPAAVVLEVGAGAGNSAFPILQRSSNPRLKIHACDFSKKAVDLIRGHELYDPRLIQADVWDVASSPDSENGGLPPGIQEGTVDVVLMIFIFSALNPAQWDQAVRNVWRVLKPGGQVLFRDYGRGDLAQVRFKKGRYMQENFYVRGDGTRVYFFDKEELEGIWTGTGVESAASQSPSRPQSQTLSQCPSQSQASQSSSPPSSSRPQSPPPSSLSTSDATQQPKEPSQLPASSDPDPRPAFQTAHIGIDRRMLVNRQRRLKMYRCWMQAVFRKEGAKSEVAVREMLAQDKGEKDEAGNRVEGMGEGAGEIGGE